MTKYTGKHRHNRAWNRNKTIASALITTGILPFPAMSISAAQDTNEIPRVEPSALVLPATQLRSVLEPNPAPVPRIVEPPREGDGSVALNEWLAAGAPGYIPDSGGTKGVVADGPKTDENVHRIEAQCEREPASFYGLSPNAAKVYEVVCALFPEITAFGGLRVGDPQDHGSGNAIDCMVDYATGDALVNWLLSHIEDLPLKYIIWKQKIIGGYTNWQWQDMEDRGSPTQNHYDHVHISVY